MLLILHPIAATQNAGKGHLLEMGPSVSLLLGLLCGCGEAMVPAEDPGRSEGLAGILGVLLVFCPEFCLRL